ncbi:GTP-binding protein [Candidatus Woesebacteria bacterium]|nr:GTP-binding protein [Candidatus Woesebacteria bacterium]
MQRTPVTIVVGFLGSGKTTVISYLMEYLLSAGEKVVYIKNELGFEDLDADIISDTFPNVVTKKITVGALHHAPLGQLRSYLHQVLDEEKPDRIIIETAGSEGTADPVSLSVLVQHDPLFYNDGLFKIIDVENFTGYDQLEDYTKEKTKCVDIVFLNKLELVDQERREVVVGYIREHNETSPIVEAPEGKIHPELAFGVHMNQDKTPPKIKLYNDHIDAINYISEKTFDRSKIETAFAQLPKNVFRMKGFVKTENGVEIFNGVHARFDWLPNTKHNDSEQTKLIFVGSKIDKSKDEIFALLDGCVSTT